MSLRHRVGAVIYDWPPYVRALRRGNWTWLRNRRERVTLDAQGVRCDWRYSSDLHLARVFPRVGTRVMQMAFAQWPIVLREAPDVVAARPEVSFIIGHRGEARRPHLMAALQSIAGQRDVPIECIVVEQAEEPTLEGRLPAWVRYVFQKCATDYNRSATFNQGADVARGDLLILQDNDILIPAGYAAEVVARAREGWEFIDLKRFIFYLDEVASAAMFQRGDLLMQHPLITQNLQGGTIGVTRHAYDTIGGFDDEFVGWGGEDNDFWDRAETTGKAYRFGYLPIVHLYHAPQPGKVQPHTAPAVSRYQALESVPPADRIRRLLERRR